MSNPQGVSRRRAFVIHTLGALMGASACSKVVQPVAAPQVTPAPEPAANGPDAGPVAPPVAAAVPAAATPDAGVTEAPDAAPPLAPLTPLQLGLVAMARVALQGSPVVHGAIPPRQVQRLVGVSLGEVKACYLRLLLAHAAPRPSGNAAAWAPLNGHLDVELSIGPDGRVLGATARGTGPLTELTACAETVAKTLVLPAPTDAQPATATFRIKFTPIHVAASAGGRM